MKYLSMPISRLQSWFRRAEKNKSIRLLKTQQQKNERRKTNTQKQQCFYSEKNLSPQN
jgi:hypothetical protein